MGRYRANERLENKGEKEHARWIALLRAFLALEEGVGCRGHEEEWQGATVHHIHKPTNGGSPRGENAQQMLLRYSVKLVSGIDGDHGIVGVSSLFVITSTVCKVARSPPSASYAYE